jgi:hypothetical protein
MNKKKINSSCTFKQNSPLYRFPRPITRKSETINLVTDNLCVSAAFIIFPFIILRPQPQLWLNRPHCPFKSPTQSAAYSANVFPSTIFTCPNFPPLEWNTLFIHKKNKIQLAHKSLHFICLPICLVVLWNLMWGQWKIQKFTISCPPLHLSLEK